MDFSGVVYYHGTIGRDEARQVLSEKPDGSFLLRKSINLQDGYAISVNHLGKTLHYSIKLWPPANLYGVNKLSTFETPVLVCEHYMKKAGGLKSRLLYPVGVSTYLNVRPPRSSTSSVYEDQEWFHGKITREEDAMRLSCAYRVLHQDGIYLVREKEDSLFVLSIVHCAKVHRYKIIYDTNSQKYNIDGKAQLFPSLVELVEFYKQFRNDGLLCVLQKACSQYATYPSWTKPKPTPKPAGLTFGSPGVVARLAERLKLMIPPNSLEVPWSDSAEDAEKTSPRSPKTPTSQRNFTSILSRFNRKSMPKDSFGFQSPYCNLTSFKENKIVAPDLYIKSDLVKMGKVIGRGHFGCVRQGECELQSQIIPCAVKTMSGSDVQANREELLREVSVMQKLDHPFIVRVLAVCDDPTPSGDLKIILELAPLGSLRAFVKYENRDSFPEEQLLALMVQVCDGMAFLESKNVVHRDLAARNVLLVTEKFVKISDFGMSRVLHDSENYYRAAKPGSWPLRWYSLEALHYYKFSSKGDVWSFGVTLWEVLSYGSRPYQSLKGHEIVGMLERGKRLECPIGCSPGAYALMLQCWSEKPEQRPSFSEILPILQSMYENEN